MTEKETVHQYAYESSKRDGIATAQTALGIDKPLEEKISEPENYGGAWPRLQWQRGKDGRKVSYGKLFIHEKVSPAEFVSSLLKEREEQANWFHMFNNLPPNAHYEPYVHHEGNWSNRLIKSSGQRAMASLLEYEGMSGQVDLIYMDPPYNINFRANFQGLVEDTASGDDWKDIPMDARATKAFRDSYRNGVHSYLDQMRAQLVHARELLKESGSFIMQIGPENLHYVAVMMSEVFGHENHIATIPYRTTTNPSTSMLPEVGNWLIWFGKDKTQTKYRQIYEQVSGRKETIELWGSAARVENPDGQTRNLTRKERNNPEQIPADARLYRTYPSHSTHTSKTGRSDPFYHHPNNLPCSDNPSWTDHTCSAVCHGSKSDCPKGRKCNPDCHAIAYPCPTGRQWSVSLSGLHSSAMKGRLEIGKQSGIGWKQYEDEVQGRTLNAIWNKAGIVSNKQYIVETPPRVLERCILMTTDPGDLVLDLTCGSGAMPIQCEAWGRRWIAVDTSAVAITVARHRLATTIHQYHLLKDSLEGDRRDHEMEQELMAEDERESYRKPPGFAPGSDPAKGFVLERQTRVSAATIAYGPDPDDIIRHQDRPEIDRSKLRVTSAFTVESDHPFTSVNPEDEEAGPRKRRPEQDDVTKAIEISLTAAGITVPAVNGQPQIRYKVEELRRIADVSGATHEGRIRDEQGERHPALFYVCQDDEVGSSFQSKALGQVARNRGDRYAVVISFSHEGDIGAVQKAQGTLKLLQVNANRDHLIPGLEAKEDDHALVVISEPDLTLHQEEDGRISIQVENLTVYNPVSGQVEPQDSRNIVAILTDTEYDADSFRARLWNLPQKGKEQDRKLKQIREAFKKEIDEVKWERMRSNRTLPFAVPAGGHVAVKVIDHTGTEHMKTLKVK